MYIGDALRAFDSLNLEYLKQHLQEINFPENIISLLFRCYYNQEMKLQVNKRIMLPFYVHQGACQGDALWCFIFSFELMPYITTINHQLLDINS